MECSEPGAIRDEELIAYVAGENVRPAVEQHIAHCQGCASQLADYRSLERKLISKLYRWDCPPNEILGEYQLGLLSNEQAVAVKNHLSICVLCAAEVAVLTNFLANDPMLIEPVTSVVAQPASLNHHHLVHEAKQAVEHIREQAQAGVRRIVATLIPPQVGLAYQRGEVALQENLWPRRYSAEDVSISIQVERDPQHKGLLQMIGLVKRQGMALEALQGLPAQLSAVTTTVYTQQIDDLGNFIFSSLTPASYTLELQLADSVVVIDQLPVRLQD
jgi:hypothetical protein